MNEIMDDSIKVHYTSPGTTLPEIPDDQTIIALCNAAPRKRTLKLNLRALVKHLSVTLEECRNQVEAHKLLDRTIVRVPEVYRYFTAYSRIFLVMEFVEGGEREKVEDDESIGKLAGVIRHLQMHVQQNGIPGPLCGGTSRGRFWENEDVDLRTIPRFEEYVNRRLVAQPENTLSFRVKELVLNHNDVAPRNIIWLADGSICLTSWAAAGYYPRMMERAILGFNTYCRKDYVFTVKLEKELGPWTEDEDKDVRALRRAWFNGHRFHIEYLDEHPEWTQIGNMRFQFDATALFASSPRAEVPRPPMNVKEWSEQLRAERMANPLTAVHCQPSEEENVRQGRGHT